MSQHFWNAQILVDGFVIILGIVFAAVAHFIRRISKKDALFATTSARGPTHPMCRNYP